LTVAGIDLPPVRLPPQCAALREDVRTFLAEEIAAGHFTPRCDAWLGGFDPEFSRRLGQRGWLGMTWPKACGGHARSAFERFVVNEELLAAGAPVAAHWVGDRQTGASLLRYGTEAQRQLLMPRMARGEIFFAIGMSEPGAGSDLASVRTRAEKVAGGWALTGTKLWTSNAHRADYFFTLCRTAPAGEDRHAGLSQFIVDLRHARGVTIRPVPILTGAHHFNEVVLEDVFVPDDMVLGEIGNGWHQVTSELAFERSGPERFLSTYPLLRAALGRFGPTPQGHVAQVLGELGAQLWALRRMSLAVAGALDRGEAPDVAAALVKDLGTRFESEVFERIRLLYDAAPSLGAKDALDALLAQAVLHSPGFTLRGGTNEILRGVVARALGLR
jgi:acyl-CoA dehydrogenase